MPNTSLAVRAWMSWPVAKGLAQRRDIGDMGQQPQLDLAIVGTDQHVARFGNEDAADARALLRADRDVLQIGVVAGNAPGAGRGHGVGSVHAAGGGVDFLDQRVGVGRFQLGELPPFEHARGQIVAGIGQRLQRVGVRPPRARRRALAAGEFELIEQHLAQLLGAGETKNPAGELVRIDFHGRHAHAEIGRHAAQFGFVHAYAGRLHFR